jgi:hypothetical protein
MAPTYGNHQWSLEQRIKSLGDDWVPDRFDVISIWSYKDECKLCKRVIGLPGEIIEIRAGEIIINGGRLNDTFGTGKMATETRTETSTGRILFKYTAPDNVSPGSYCSTAALYILTGLVAFAAMIAICFDWYYFQITAIGTNPNDNTDSTTCQVDMRLYLNAGMCFPLSTDTCFWFNNNIWQLLAISTNTGI